MTDEEKMQALLSRLVGAVDLALEHLLGHPYPARLTIDERVDMLLAEVKKHSPVTDAVAPETIEQEHEKEEF